MNPAPPVTITVFTPVPFNGYLLSEASTDYGFIPLVKDTFEMLDTGRSDASGQAVV